jgi:hypothetical protein
MSHGGDGFRGAELAAQASVQIVVPGASWRELFRGKPPRKEKEAEQKKGDISNEVRKGTFLKSFDIQDIQDPYT